jgi:hypothetical protein
MIMTEEEFFKKSDRHIFIEGACHVFAMALTEHHLLCAEGYKLVRIEARNDNPPMHAHDRPPSTVQNQVHHVMVEANGHYVDIEGVFSLKDCMLKIEKTLPSNPWTGMKLACSNPPLPTNQQEIEYFMGNNDLAQVEKSFVCKARQRADAVIARSPDTYRVSTHLGRG